MRVAKIMKRFCRRHGLAVSILGVLFLAVALFPWKTEATGRSEWRQESHCAEFRQSYGVRGASTRLCVRYQNVQVQWCEYIYTNAFTSWKDFGGGCRVSRVKLDK